MMSQYWREGVKDFVTTLGLSAKRRDDGCGGVKKSNYVYVMSFMDVTMMLK
jgi:hypothetical protein